MTREQTSAMLYHLTVAFPNSKIQGDDDTLDLWARHFADDPVELVRVGVDAYIAANVFPPNVAHIRAEIVKIMSHARGELSAGEAWAKVRKALGHYGYNRPEEARAHLGAHLWGVIDQIGGWMHLCMSENIDVMQGYFVKRYEAKAERDRYVQTLPPAVLDMARALAGAMTGQPAIEGPKPAALPQRGLTDG